MLRRRRGIAAADMVARVIESFAKSTVCTRILVLPGSYAQIPDKPGQLHARLQIPQRHTGPHIAVLCALWYAIAVQTVESNPHDLLDKRAYLPSWPAASFPPFHRGHHRCAPFRSHRGQSTRMTIIEERQRDDQREKYKPV